MHLRRDGDVGKEGVVPAHENAVAFKVFDDVEDLLALRLPHHPANVQQGGDVLLPVGRTDAKRKKSTKVLADAESFWNYCAQSSFRSNGHVRESVSGKVDDWHFL